MNKNGKVSIGIERFLWKYPLLGGLVASWKTISDTTIATMAIGLNRDGFLLYFNPEFVEKITMDQLVGVLHHEARHAIYGHVFLKPEDYPDGIALTVAEEVTVNEDIPEPLPGKPIRLRQYPQLKKNTDTDTRYRILAKPQPKVQPMDAGTNEESKPDEPDSGNDPGKDSSAKEENDDSTESTEAGGSDESVRQIPKSSKNDKNSRAGTPRPAQTIDDHSRWGEIAKQEVFAKSVLESTVQQIMEKKPDLSDYERQIIEHAQKEWGITPGQGISDLNPDKPGTPLHWTAILRRYTGKSLCRSISYSRPPRRFPELLGIVPGSIRRGGKPKVLAVIDTSGSMTDDVLGEVSAELTRMGRDYEIMVVECDSMIHRVYPHKAPIRSVLGRGGTDFHPPLEPSFLRKQRPDLVVFFTDGYGPAPEKKPQIPVIWVLTEGGVPPVKWGQVVEMVPKSQ